MTSLVSWRDAIGQFGRSILQWMAGWVRIVHFGAVIVVLAFTPSTYGAENRTAMARHIYLDTVPVLLSFTVMTSVFSLVLSRIVVVTALSYGLTRYAIEMVIRVLVLELLPLAAALFVALRCTIPSGSELARLRRRGEIDAMAGTGVDPRVREVLPRVMGGMVATLTLAAVSSMGAMVLSYLAMYGFTLSGLVGYTRMFGQVFTPAVAIIFMLKTLFFSLTVSLVPMASAMQDHRAGDHRTSAELRALVRMFAVVLAIEVVALVGNYS
ncbi:MAG: ABC transporter permease [Burkholderiales bacterium]|nr:ABC transporter permease [Burkholderiales bacterium]